MIDHARGALAGRRPRLKEIVMKGQRRGFHGSRAYNSDDEAPGQLDRLVNWLAGIAGLMFPRRPSSKAPLDDAERRFTLLGAGSRAGTHERASDCPFPTGPATERNHYDCRVLP